MLTLLQGYRTYIFGAISIAFALASVWYGTMDVQAAGIMVMGALSIMGIRGSVAAALRLILTAIGVQLPPVGSGLVKIKKAVQAFHSGAKRAVPMLAMSLVLAAGLSACASGSFFADPQNDLQIAEDGFAAAQVLYNTVCASNAEAAFCTPANMQTANDAALAVRHAIASAKVILASSDSSSAQITAAIQGVRNAVSDFTNLVNDLQAKKAKAMQAKAAARISLWQGVKGWVAAHWRG